jgi:hypothetical protein
VTFTTGTFFSRAKIGTPTKLQVSKCQVSKRPVSKFLKRQVYKMSGLQNDRSSKRQVFKTSGCKKTTTYILYMWLVDIRRFVAAMFAGKVMAVFYSLF